MFVYLCSFLFFNFQLAMFFLYLSELVSCNILIDFVQRGGKLVADFNKMLLCSAVSKHAMPIVLQESNEQWFLIII